METENRINLRKAALQRKNDAHALLEKQRWRGAMYLGGYAIECKLKRNYWISITPVKHYQN